MNFIKSSLVLFSTLMIVGSCTQDDDDLLLNQIPLANAGPSQSLQLPFVSASLNGTGSDADGTIVAYLWSQVSGPSNTTIVNPGSASTQVSGFVAGTYVFQLMVTDEDGAVGVDTASIEAKAPVSTTVTFQPSNSSTEMLIAVLGSSDASNPICPDLHISRWTNGGTNYTSRAAIKFDMSSIPAGATITSARLYLYSYPTPTLTGNFVDANLGPDNGLYIRQITNTWSETLGWATQPSTTTVNEISVPATSQARLDLDLDVKNMVSSMVAGSANYGFQVRLQNETDLYNLRTFVSSSNTTYTDKHPKLVVTYQ